MMLGRKGLLFTLMNRLGGTNRMVLWLVDFPVETQQAFKRAILGKPGSIGKQSTALSRTLRSQGLAVLQLSAIASHQANC